MGNQLLSLRAPPPPEDERNHPLYYDWSLPEWSPFKSVVTASDQTSQGGNLAPARHTMDNNLGAAKDANNERARRLAAAKTTGGKAAPATQTTGAAEIERKPARQAALANHSERSASSSGKRQQPWGKDVPPFKAAKEPIQRGSFKQRLSAATGQQVASEISTRNTGQSKATQLANQRQQSPTTTVANFKTVGDNAQQRPMVGKQLKTINMAAKGTPAAKASKANINNNNNNATVAHTAAAQQQQQQRTTQSPELQAQATSNIHTAPGQQPQQRQG